MCWDFERYFSPNDSRVEIPEEKLKKMSYNDFKKRAFRNEDGDG